jgi:Domain of unknown function (DUF6851)/VCPO second helical-bundle domain
MNASDPTFSRRRLLETAAAGGAALLAARMATPIPAWASARSQDTNVVLRWNAAALQGVRDSKLGPPMVARALAIVHTCIYDAWAAYDEVAVGTRLGGSLRQPHSERTLQNKNAAISFAAYRATGDLFPGSRSSVFDPLMRELGYDSGDTSTDGSAAGCGNVAAKAVLDFRHRDGANQLGDEPGGAPGVPYADYTGFVPANAPMDIQFPLDLTTVHDPNAWQPLRYTDATGMLVTQTFVGAQFTRVTPFALSTTSQLRAPSGPALYGSGQYREQAAALLAISASLDDEQKMIAEYWADGPHSELPPGHWDLFAQFVSNRDHHGANERGVDLDVKLFFALTNAIFDAGLCAWDNKRAFASVRPVTALRYLYAGQTILAWAGPYRGTAAIRGESWLPYQPTTFPTPPFPEYSSGHSCFSAAGAEILKRFTDSDDFGASVTFAKGSSRVEPAAVPGSDLTLRWATFSDAAAQAGISRRYGGIHFEQADLDARAQGRAAAINAWDKVLKLFVRSPTHP